MAGGGDGRPLQVYTAAASVAKIGLLSVYAVRLTILKNEINDFNFPEFPFYVMPLKHFMCSATNLFSFRRARIRTSTAQTTTKNTKLNRQQNENAITAHVVMMLFETDFGFSSPCIVV
ncbi:hypothetical protein QTP88_003101 [Uroleucon formosanum]